MIRGYRVLWAFDGRPKAEEFFGRREAMRRANGLVSLSHKTRLQHRNAFSGEWKDVRPSQWDATLV